MMDSQLQIIEWKFEKLQQMQLDKEICSAIWDDIQKLGMTWDLLPLVTSMNKGAKHAMFSTAGC